MQADVGLGLAGEAGEVADIIKEPNNVLGIEYLKALKKTNISPMIITRTAVGHNEEKYVDNITNASNIRKMIMAGDNNFNNYVPENFDDFKNKNNDGEFYFLTRYGKKPHTSFDYSNKDENIYLIFGKESTGIPKEILKDDLEHCMRIPMTDKVRALNVSNSVAIMVYEVLRQQDYRDLLRTEPFKGEDYLTKE